MTESSNQKRPAFWKRALHVARIVFTPLSVLVILFFVWRSRAELGEILQDGHWSLLLIALLLWIATNILAPLVTVYLFRSCQMQIGYGTTLFIHCSRLPAKYLPGGIWHSVGRAADYSTLGHRGKKIGAYFIVENFLLVAVTLGMSAGFVDNMIRIPALQTAVSLLPYCMAVALLVFPWVLQTFAQKNEPFSVTGYFMALGLLIVYWCMIGIAFVTYISAFDGLQLMTSTVETAAIYIFSWVLGYMALFAPQGIGVAEYISGTLLTDGNQAGAILALLVGFRVLALVADLVTWFLVTFVKRKAEKNR
jgi:glycosyltransferase 2 family protein